MPHMLQICGCFPPSKSRGRQWKFGHFLSCLGLLNDVLNASPYATDNMVSLDMFWWFLGGGQVSTQLVVGDRLPHV